MCRRLVAQGGFVIAADRDEDALHDLARATPDRIAPLMLEMSDTRTLRRLCDTWSGEPLHLLLMAHPLHETLLLDHALTSVAGVTAALGGVIAAAEGAAVLMFRAAEPEAPASAQAGAEALSALTRTLAAKGTRINALALHAPALAPAMAERVCTTALMMALPMAAAVSGAVLPVGRRVVSR
ncbi:MAG: hypothetical protein EP318_17885 [Rhodobacteraceae bacterium]|nr:MAG: hypothetical protein EP318_17885 [Paracoccaceae bacterium]